jgi:hypothetical protein
VVPIKKTEFISRIQVLVSAQINAAVISYYRFEVDNNPDPLRLDTPNEISGEPPLTAFSARIDNTAQSSSLPNLFVPINGLPNTASLDGIGPDASGNPDIDARAAYTSALDLDELTVELYVRTEESIGVIVSRSGANDVLSNITNGYGFRIYDPQDLKVDFYTNDGSGNGIFHNIATADGLDNISPVNGEAAWRHLAFSYEQATGIGNLYLDGSIIETTTAAAGQGLFWGSDPSASEPELQVGVAMDGFNFSKGNGDDGYIDELRISRVSLGADDFLIVPEPSMYAAILGLFALTFCVAQRRNLR